MPEHRAETPPVYRVLESFLWHDMDAGETAWRAWLRHREFAPDSGDAEAALQLHAALRALQTANVVEARGAKRQDTAREELNRLADARGLRPVVRSDGSVGLRARQAADPVAQILVDALEAMRSGTWRRFKLCQDETCRASFYDASKASRKIWCDMATCGSKNKMRRYRRRQGENDA